MNHSYSFVLAGNLYFLFHILIALFFVRRLLCDVVEEVTYLKRLGIRSVMLFQTLLMLMRNANESTMSSHLSVFSKKKLKWSDAIPSNSCQSHYIIGLKSSTKRFIVFLFKGAQIEGNNCRN